jgi:hypothetical protein
MGLMPLGTTMDYESADSRTKGCWDPASILTPFYEKWTSATETPDFVVDDVWCGMVGSLGFGGAVTAEVIEFWNNALKDIYKGDEGRKKVRMAAICLLERDGLLLRLRDVQCPVYWLQVSLERAPLAFSSVSSIRILPTLLPSPAHLFNHDAFPCRPQHTKHC